MRAHVQRRRVVPDAVVVCTRTRQQGVVRRRFIPALLTAPSSNDSAAHGFAPLPQLVHGNPDALTCSLADVVASAAGASVSVGDRVVDAATGKKAGAVVAACPAGSPLVVLASVRRTFVEVAAGTDATSLAAVANVPDPNATPTVAVGDGGDDDADDGAAAEAGAPTARVVPFKPFWWSAMLDYEAEVAARGD